MIMDESTLRSRYRQLMERRRTTAGGSSVPLETLEALVEDRLAGVERIAVLEAVYSDPAAKREFEFLRELARERPERAGRRWGWLAAASVVLMFGGGLLWRASSPISDPLRGPEAAVTLLAPAAGATVVVGDSLAWRPMTGALGYVVEVVTDDGEVAFRVETTDTVVAFGVPAGRTREGPAQWWVAASLGGSASTRSAARRIVLAP